MVLKPEWSHRVEAENINEKGCRFEIKASEQECIDMARRLKVNAITGMQADIRAVRQLRSHIIHVTGRFSASVTQDCIISGESLVQAIENDLEGWFSEDEHIVSLAKARREKMVTHIDSEIQIADEKDDPDSVVDGWIDLGELVAQHLALDISPYPQKDGVQREYTEDELAEMNKEARHNPFAALKDWKAKKRK